MGKNDVYHQIKVYLEKVMRGERARCYLNRVVANSDSTYMVNSDTQITLSPWNDASHSGEVFSL